jgi:hypothetical protein
MNVIMVEQMKRWWRVLRRAISSEILDFASAYDPGFKRDLGVTPRPGTTAAFRDPQQKRQLWIELWCRIAEMIAVHEAGYVRAFPNNAEWASRAVEFMRAGLLDFQRKLRVQHSDMPEIGELRLDPATGRHYAAVTPIVAERKGMPS